MGDEHGLLAEHLQRRRRLEKVQRPPLDRKHERGRRDGRKVAGPPVICLNVGSTAVLPEVELVRLDNVSDGVSRKQVDRGQLSAADYPRAHDRGVRLLFPNNLILKKNRRQFDHA
jgi:hypothetical protein